MTDENFEEEYIISKTQIKREMQALRDLGKELIALTPSQLKKIPLSENLLADILQAKGFKHKALKRQIQHMGVLMRNEDAEAIRKALDTLHKPQKKAVRELHEIEQWRDRLLEGDGELLNDLIRDHEDIDRQYLMQLIRNAKTEKKLNKAPKSTRSLFKYLFQLKTNKKDE